MKKVILNCLLLLSTTCFAFTDQTTQFPEATFRSVNTYNTSTIYQSHITPVGATDVYGTITQTYKPEKIRKNTMEFPEDPFMTPIGDVPIVFILGLSILYVLVIGKKERVEN